MKDNRWTEKSNFEKLMNVMMSFDYGAYGADVIRVLDSSLDSETKALLQEFLVRLHNGQSSKDLLQPRIEEVRLPLYSLTVARQRSKQTVRHSICDSVHPVSCFRHCLKAEFGLILPAKACIVNYSHVSPSEQVEIYLHDLKPGPMHSISLEIGPM